MPPTYYCPSCANSLGLKSGIDTTNLLGTTYQLGKFGKHTSTSGSSRDPVRTVFDSKSTADYAKCITETIALGFVEIRGTQKNICYPPSTGSALGHKLNWGVEASKTDTVVVVNTSQATALHAFLENSSNYSTGRCAKGGCRLW
jgi:hypothetical protein